MKDLQQQANHQPPGSPTTYTVTDAKGNRSTVTREPSEEYEEYDDGYYDGDYIDEPVRDSFLLFRENAVNADNCICSPASEPAPFAAQVAP